MFNEDTIREFGFGPEMSAARREICLGRIDSDLDLLRTGRERAERVIARLHGEYQGEAWVGLDDRRAESSALRGTDRREFK